MIFIKILKNTIQIKNKKYYIDMIADMLSDKRLNPIVTELFITGKNLNISFVFITQSYFTIQKNITLNSTHYFTIQILNKRGLQQIASNHSPDIDFQDFYIKIYMKNVL